jgi:alpha-beta hydrolase superfamily lysophospholipase
MQSVEIATSDGIKIFAFASPPQPGKPIVILFHGNASYPESYGFLYVGWMAGGFGIVAPAARGYPRSSGEADGEKMLVDALEIFDWARQTYPDHPIVTFGQSLGTAPAIHVAANRPVAGVVLVSPFRSMLSLVRSKLPYFPISALLTSPFRSDLDMPRIAAPMLVFHGDLDQLVPISSAGELVALTKAPVTFDTTEGAGHAAGLFDNDMIDRIYRFISAAK